MRNVVTLVLVFAAFGPVFAQKKVGAEEIRALLDCGFDEAAVISVITKPNMVIEIDEAGLQKLEAAKAPPGIIAALRQRALKGSGERLTVQGILDLFAAGATEETLLQRIQSASHGIVLSVDDVLRLSRAGIPANIMRALREKRSVPTEDVNTLSKDDVIRMTTLGIAPSEIVSRIRLSESTFDLSPEEVLDLNRRGVDRDVLKEMYRRSKRHGAVAESQPSVSPTSQPAVISTDDLPKAEAKPLEILHERGAGFSILHPAGFRVVKEFKGRKTLVQILPAENFGDLPEVEISVLVARARDEDVPNLLRTNLKNVAQQFATGLKDSYRADGIIYAAQEPKPMRLAAADAVISTTTSTAPDGSGHVGQSALLFSSGSIYVVSTNCKLELSGEWRDVLETCLRSLVIEKADRPAISFADADTTTAVKKLFEAWRTSLADFDFAAFNQLLAPPKDDPTSRSDFVREALVLERESARVEFAEFDAGRNVLSVNVFTKSGERRRQSLPLERKKGEWRLSSISMPEKMAGAR